MFAIEEEVDKKLWLYAIHMGKDRSEVVNDLLRPVVASMVLYDSRDRRSGRNSELAVDRTSDAENDLQNERPGGAGLTFGYGRIGHGESLVESAL